MAAFWFGRKDLRSQITTPPSVIAPTLTSTPEGTFSVAVLPDTQQYVKAADKSVTNPSFQTHVDWILENLDWQKIVFVTHVGDIVDRNETTQWRFAQQQMGRLEGRVPYGISVGNHDMGGKGDSTSFQEHFGVERFKRFAWYAGSYPGDAQRRYASGNNANSYQLLSAQGLKLMFLHLECNAPDGVLAWANEKIQAHPDHLVCITSHMDLGPEQKPDSSLEMFAAPKGRMQWKKTHGEFGNSPQQMWDKCYKWHANVRLIFCGDQRRTASFLRRDLGVHGNLVHSMLSDYSPLSAKHLATLQRVSPVDHLFLESAQASPIRLCRFYPEHGEVHVMTYDTARHELIDGTPSAPRREQHQFILKGVFEPIQKG